MPDEMRRVAASVNGIKRDLILFCAVHSRLAACLFCNLLFIELDSVSF